VSHPDILDEAGRRRVERCRACRMPLGRPAVSAAACMRSAQSGVWCECLRITALPAMSAGMTAFTAVR
jgi:hypothetical protein